MPTVYLDRNPRTMPADTSCVSHDSVATGQLAAKELLVTGHPHFAFVPYPQPRFWSDDRERGFRDALALNGLKCETFDGGGRGTLQSVAWQKSLRRMAEIRFRQIAGRSILDEIQAVRLDKAKELLKNSSLDVSAIANFCGFKAANALWKFFRQETGVSPSEWRKLNS